MTHQVTSLLVITPMSGEGGLILPPYSARGLSQTLNWITGASGGGVLGSGVRESINGELINLFPPQFRKLESTITCKDVETPCLDEAYFGQIVTVHCAAELSYLTGSSPRRPEVSGSSRVDGHFTFYRPQLVMMVIEIDNTFAEFEREYSWKVGLREWKIPA
jgi:hypothetical protein